MKPIQDVSESVTAASLPEVYPAAKRLVTGD